MSSAPIPLAKIEINKAIDDPPRQVEVKCDHLWSLAQYQAIKRLSTYRREHYLFGETKWMLESDFSIRAARIAGTYASFYLEKEDGGNEKLKGRFYWMGLAAFASKQVMCGLDFTKLATAAMPLGKPLVDIGKNGLGKGNLWLFQDIFCWHWFYSKYPSKFEECSVERNSEAFEGKIKNALKALPWAKESLPVVDDFKLKQEVAEAFSMIKQAEGKGPGREKQFLQFKSLIATANHEQLNILQPLIYEQPVFRAVLDVQKIVEGMPLVPLRSAAFSTACDVKQPELREQMYEGDLYSAQARMGFINKIAVKYHELMINRKEYMEGVIAEISGWRGRV
ncbi:hypothetical protein J3D47_002836 [Pseudomonas laurylsulfativorans]|uniref:DUF2515 family protein n=1 Tax=Pseudomonas laurylsulfativorans TaxID=1943631 RepID=UPI00209D2290|nr:hypothetical protein [Pseudomonas laurylsulfativorans]MCP1418593.1 hypothetical protein [Pseudomonas laurylsulfativorans]